MEQRIKGRRYNTKSARRIASWTNNLPTSDFRVVEETLFQKRTSEYFLYGKGGPQSSYGEVKEDGSIGYGSEIIPLTFEQARAWAQEKLSSEEYRQSFKC